MFAYLAAGLIVGGLMWFLSRRPGDPPVGIQVGVGVMAAGIAGLAVNLLFGDDDFMAISPWGFAASALAAAAALLFVKSRSRRSEADQIIDG